MKAIVTFATGVLHLWRSGGAVPMRACGLQRGRFFLFGGLHLHELASWGRSQPRVWIDPLEARDLALRNSPGVGDLHLTVSARA